MFSVRPSDSRDYEAFGRLVLELAVDDPVLSAERWERERMPTTLVAEIEGVVQGFAFYQRLVGVGFVRGLVVSPSERRSGIGRALMMAVADALRPHGIAEWHLNVKPDNQAALHLYQSLGLKRAYASTALRFPWRALESLPDDEPSLTPRILEPSEDPDLEREIPLLPGQLSASRKRQGQIIFTLQRTDGSSAGVASFDPTFPGAPIFRVARPGLAKALLGACREHALPEHDDLQVLVEDDAALKALLMAHGAVVRLEILHYQGELPARL